MVCLLDSAIENWFAWFYQFFGVPHSVACYPIFLLYRNKDLAGMKIKFIVEYRDFFPDRYLVVWEATHVSMFRTSIPYLLVNMN